MEQTIPTGMHPGVLCVLAFFLGAIPFGFIAGKFKHKDLREHGSKNIGATNTMRVLGYGWGTLVLLLDAVKGYIPVAFAQREGLSSSWFVGAGLCAVLGHIFSPFVRFRGGKGVATSLGVLFGLSWVVALASLGVFIVPVLITRWVALGSILGALTQAILFFVLPTSYFQGDPWPYRLFGLAVAVFVVIRHRSNIQRILAGTESRFGERAASKVASSDDAKLE